MYCNVIHVYNVPIHSVIATCVYSYGTWTQRYLAVYCAKKLAIHPSKTSASDQCTGYQCIQVNVKTLHIRMWNIGMAKETRSRWLVHTVQ